MRTLHKIICTKYGKNLSGKRLHHVNKHVIFLIKVTVEYAQFANTTHVETPIAENIKLSSLGIFVETSGISSPKIFSACDSTFEEILPHMPYFQGLAVLYNIGEEVVDISPCSVACTGGSWRGGCCEWVGVGVGLRNRSLVCTHRNHVHPAG